MTKRIVCALLALLMLAGVFAGCASEKKETTEKKPSAPVLDDETKALYETVVLTIDGEPITYEKYRYYYHIGVTTYLETNNNKLGEGAEEEINKMVLGELKSEYAIRKLAKEFGVTVSDKDKESIESYIESQKYYAALQGMSYEETLAANYCTITVFKEWMTYYYFLENGVYEYLYDEKNDVIDRSDDAVKKELEKYNAALHILLTKKNYSTEENVETLGKELESVLKKASALKAEFKDNIANSDAAEKLSQLLTAYQASIQATSYMGSFSGYTNKVTALKDQLLKTDPSTAINYLKKAADALTATDDATKAVKALASLLAADGFSENSKTDIEKAYADYQKYIEKKKLEFFGVSDDEDFDVSTATYPTGKEYDALFALQLIDATHKELKEGKEGSLAALSEELLANAFSYAVLIFGEDRQDHENGVYFKDDEIDETFEEAYFKLEMSEISAPIKTEYGYHVINRVPTDFDYFNELLYIEYAIEDYLKTASDHVTVELTDFYNTIKPDELK